MIENNVIKILYTFDLNLLTNIKYEFFILMLRAYLNQDDIFYCDRECIHFFRFDNQCMMTNEFFDIKFQRGNSLYGFVRVYMNKQEVEDLYTLLTLNPKLISQYTLEIKDPEDYIRLE